MQQFFCSELLSLCGEKFCLGGLHYRNEVKVDSPKTIHTPTAHKLIMV